MADNETNNDGSNGLARQANGPASESGKRAVRRKAAFLSEGSRPAPPVEKPATAPEGEVSLAAVASATVTEVPPPSVASTEGKSADFSPALESSADSEVVAPEKAPSKQREQPAVNSAVVSQRERKARKGRTTATPAEAKPPVETGLVSAAIAVDEAAASAAETAVPQGSMTALASRDTPKSHDPNTKSAVSQSVFSFKDATMDMSSNFNGFQGVMSEAQAKAKEAFEKSTNVLGEVGDFTKGNVEAVIESGKIFADGCQEMGSSLVAESRTAFEAMTTDVKELAAAKSPTDFFKIQSDMVRKNFDTAVAYGSKNSEAMLKLMSDAMAPISGRVSLAVEKARQTATPSATV
ncbi:phasin family protein [Novosphingobium sp. RD2P27]|uniref:Phasin family protein n=1 Tax=Novosphingobium kalidii TaxID=3230299 RepID=A0ABV2D5F0_9SPHN